MFSFFPSRVLPLKVDTESCHEYVHQNGIPTSPPSCEIIEIKGDQFADKAEAEHLDLSSLDLYALAVATAVGGHYLPWNEGLQGGFGTFIIAVAFIASGYFCLILSLSELSSALPFAGKLMYQLILLIIDLSQVLTYNEQGVRMAWPE